VCCAVCVREFDLISLYWVSQKTRENSTTVDLTDLVRLVEPSIWRSKIPGKTSVKVSTGLTKKN
jgi:hypothetical protein